MEKPKHSQTTFQAPLDHETLECSDCAMSFLKLQSVYGRSLDLQNFRVGDLNQNLADLLKKPKTEMIGRLFDSLFPNGILGENLAKFLKIASIGEPHFEEKTLETNGEILTYRLEYIPDELGITLRILDVTKDRTRGNILDDQRRFIEKLAGSLPEFILVTDASETTLVYRNRDFISSLGFPADTFHRAVLDLREFIHPEDIRSFDDHQRELRNARDEEILETTCRIHTAKGDWRWFRIRTSIFSRDINGKPKELLRTIQDVSSQVWMDIELREKVRQLNLTQIELKERQEQLQRLNQQLASLATTDGLTGLYNYRAFNDKLDEEIRRARRHCHPLSLVLCDIDNFKQFNDHFGHLDGDERLRFFARVLREGSRASDFVARYGGEEFAMILVNTDVLGASRYAEGLRQRLNEDDGDHSIKASFGCVELLPSDSKREDLIARADECLYAAKRQGKNRVVFSEIRSESIHSA